MIFGIIIRHAIRRGTFTSVKELVTAISRFIDGWSAVGFTRVARHTAARVVDRDPLVEYDWASSLP